MVYHVEQYTESGYYDMVARAFLCAISHRSKEYWDDISHSSPLRWTTWEFLSTRISLTKVIDMIAWSVESPSTELLVALDEFDVYTFAAGTFNWEGSWSLYKWTTIIERAKVRLS